MKGSRKDSILYFILLLLQNTQELVNHYDLAGSFVLHQNKSREVLHDGKRIDKKTKAFR